MASDPPPTDMDSEPIVLEYAKELQAPGHVDDLLKLNKGCFWISLLWFGWPIPFLLYRALETGVPLWRAVEYPGRYWLVVPLVLGAIWVFSPAIRRVSARQAAIRRGDVLRPGEVVLQATVLHKGIALRRNPTLQVRFTLAGTTVTSRRQVDDVTWWRASVGDSIPIAVDTRTRKWRALPPPASRCT